MTVVESDHAGLLTNLLRYPSPSTLYPFSPFLILSQALLLRNSVTPTTGVEVVIQNHEILGVRARTTEREAEPVRVHKAAPPRGVQGLAAGLFERAQAAGLDRAILSTVADIRVSMLSSCRVYALTVAEYPRLGVFIPAQSPLLPVSCGPRLIRPVLYDPIVYLDFPFARPAPTSSPSPHDIVVDRHDCVCQIAGRSRATAGRTATGDDGDGQGHGRDS